MKRLRTLFLTMSLGFFCLTGFSQAFSISDLSSLSDQYTFEKSRNMTSDGTTYSNIDGSPFLNDEFIPGEVVINDTVHIEKVPLRLNIYSHKMEFLDAQKQVLEIDLAQKGYQFNYGGLNFTQIDYVDDGNKVRGVLQLLADGNFRLYKKYLIKFEPATQAIGYQDAKPDRFVRLNDEYLLAVGENAPETFKATKNVFEKLKELKPGIEQYVKKEKIKVKSEKGLIELIRYCNQ